MTNHPPKTMAYWFLLLCVLVAITAAIGAITRLTDSGLSIMEWDVTKAAWPSAALIDEYYALYQTIPQYDLTQFTREEFTSRVFWEWFHRNWGRLVGLIALAGAIWFFARGRVTPDYRLAVLAAPVLIGMQGVIGWFMVASGFSTLEDVSHYRLALHLGTAFFAFGLYLWTAMRILHPHPAGDIPFGPWAWAFAALCLTMLFGAYTAGLNAAAVSSSWPKFNPDSFLPPAICADVSVYDLTYWFNGKCGVHFIHRHLAEFAALLVLFAAFQTWLRSDQILDRMIAVCAALLVLAQVFLGIWIILNGVPIGLATLHQLGALGLITISLIAIYNRKRI